MSESFQGRENRGASILGFKSTPSESICLLEHVVLLVGGEVMDVTESDLKG